VMLASMGLVPIGYALSGLIAELDPTVLFLAAGGLMLITAGVAAMSKTARAI